MNKYLLVTSSAMILAKMASASLEIDAKENKAIINKTEFNKKISEINPPSLVLPPFSSSKDYKRLTSICFLGIGNCDSNISFNKGDDYTRECEPSNPCIGFGVSPETCTEGFTTCDTGCEIKHKCNPAQYTQTCDYPYQGVGSPIAGKYMSCECESSFIYGTSDCPSPQVPNTAGASCEGKYSSCTCPSDYTETCATPLEGIGESCDGKYAECSDLPCADRGFTQTCSAPTVGVGESCDGKYAECSDLPCADRGFTQTCNAPTVGVGESCDGKYASCKCPNTFTLTCNGQVGMGDSCDGKYAECSDLPCADRGFTQTCNAPYIGDGESCDGAYKACKCPTNYDDSCTAQSMVGVGTACNGLFAECKCKPIFSKSCPAPMTGVNGCGGLYESCQCPSSYKTCSAPLTGVGTACDGKYASCTCTSCVTCRAPEIGAGPVIFDGMYAACKCPPEYNQRCTANQSCSAYCGGLCSSCYIPGSGNVTPPSDGDFTIVGGGDVGHVGSECPSYICW